MSERHHDHDHDHDDHAEISQSAKAGYYEIMEIAVRELLIERHWFGPEGDTAANRGAELAHAGLGGQGRGARLDGSGFQGAPARQRPDGDPSRSMLPPLTPEVTTPNKRCK